MSSFTLPAMAQSFRVQCPGSTITHPVAANNNAEPTFVGPTYVNATKVYPTKADHVNGAIKCQQIGGGDGYATMGDGTQTYLFSFGPLSGLADMAAGKPGTQFPSVFNTTYTGPQLVPGDPATTDNLTDPQAATWPPPPFAPTFAYNGAVGQVPDTDNGNVIDGHVDPRQTMDVGVMNGNIPAPLMAIDEDDEFFLTLTNAGRLGGDQHRRQLHLLLPGARRRHVLLALPHHPARAPADGHGRADLRAAAAEPRGKRGESLHGAPAAGARPAHQVRLQCRHPVQQPAARRL
jgi:hypothetical protein